MDLMRRMSGTGRRACELLLVIALGMVLAACGKRDAECVERVDPDCVCTMEYDPVCGCNGKTYPNACTAQCHGIARFTPGPCAKS